MHLDFSSLFVVLNVLKAQVIFRYLLELISRQFLPVCLALDVYLKRVVSLLAGALFWARNDLFYLQVV